MHTPTTTQTIATATSIVAAIIATISVIASMRRLRNQALDELDEAIEQIRTLTHRLETAEQERISARSETRIYRQTLETERSRLDAIIATQFPGGQDFARDIKRITQRTITAEDEYRNAARHAEPFPPIKQSTTEGFVTPPARGWSDTCWAVSTDGQYLCARPDGHDGLHGDGWHSPQDNTARCNAGHITTDGVAKICNRPAGHKGPHSRVDTGWKHKEWTQP